jgi:hypothetical protein
MRQKRPTRVDVTIRIEPTSAERLDAIVQALRDAGLENIDVHRRFLVINGTSAAATLDALRAVNGVASIRKDRGYHTQE